MIWKIPRCYDSHTHLMGTGMMQRGLRLFDLQKAEDIQHVQIERHHFRGEWLVGFGWDQSKWPGAQYPSKEILDKVFPDFPVALSRADGHGIWLNSKALQKAGYLDQTEAQKQTPSGGIILRDSRGFPTGIFIELAKIEVEQLIPPYSREQEKEFLREAISYFNARGFSHLRDMSGSGEQWDILRELDLDGALTLYIDENFTCENIQGFAKALIDAKKARENKTAHLNPRGIKFYFDGALGSQGAFLSQFYPGTMSKGITLWPLHDVATVVEETWRAGFEVCVHTIGDEAVHQILQTVTDVVQKKNIRGTLNIEHGEVIRPETIALMKPLSVVCHIQPCHWLSDRRWLEEKLPDLAKFAFPWQSLQKNGVPIQWGSDSPIEEASVYNNWLALTESPQAGIPAFQGDLLAPHTHRDTWWGAECASIFENGKLKSFVFDGRKLI